MLKFLKVDFPDSISPHFSSVDRALPLNFSGYRKDYNEMMISTPVERVRMAISAQLSKLTGQPVPSLHESILIRNGLYCGRKFLAVDHEVVWFIEEDEIKFFGPSGTLISADSVVSFLNRYDSTEQIHEPSFQRRAA